jgi:hypothetical protein
MPIYARPQGSLPWLSVPIGGYLTPPQLSQPSARSHICQRHYPHSARPHRANPARGFLP